MKKAVVEQVPRYFGPHAHDCFANAYATVLLHMGLNPDIILADYLSFLYDEEGGYIGTTYLFKPYTTVEFTEEQMNTSLEFVYFPATTIYSGREAAPESPDGRVHIHLYIQDDAVQAHERVKQLIDGGIPVIAFVDLFYIPYHGIYQKQHQIHAVIITGYDDEAKEYALFDKHRISYSDFDGRLPYEAVQAARLSEYPITNPLIGEHFRPIRSLWAEIHAAEDFRITDERILAILSESCLRMKGERILLGQPCGLERIHALRRALQTKKERPFDDREVFRFKNHYLLHFKMVSRSRQRFGVFLNEAAALLPPALLPELSASLSEAVKCWDICSTLSLKLAMSKKLSLLDELDVQLAAVQGHEAKVVEALDRWLHLREHAAV